jgi:hypothetical protein
VPLSASSLSSAASLWGAQEGRPLFVASDANALILASKLVTALHADWPQSTPSELTYTGYWNQIGFDLPFFAGQLLQFDVQMSRCVSP